MGMWSHGREVEGQSVSELYVRPTGMSSPYVANQGVEWVFLLQSWANGNGSTGRKRYRWPEDATKRGA